MNASLPAARAATAAARARHAADVAALTRGRERLAASATELKRLAAEDEAAVARHAQRLEKQTRAGDAGPVPQLLPSDKHLAAEIAARRTHQAARQMLASLESAARQSAPELAQAEEALRSAVLAEIGEEAARMAHELVQARTQVEQLEALLNACREIPDIGPHLAVNVHVALRDDLNTPINLIPDRGDFARPVGEVRLRPTPVNASTHWEQRIEQLLTGAGTEPTSTSVAA